MAGPMSLHTPFLSCFLAPGQGEAVQMSLFTLVSARSQALPHQSQAEEDPFLGLEPLSGDHSILLPPCLSAVLDWDRMMETSIQSEGV